MSAPIRKEYTPEYVSSVVRDNKAKTESLQSLTNNLVNEKVKIRDLEKNYSTIVSVRVVNSRDVVTIKQHWRIGSKRTAASKNWSIVIDCWSWINNWIDSRCTQHTMSLSLRSDLMQY